MAVPSSYLWLGLAAIGGFALSALGRSRMIVGPRRGRKVGDVMVGNVVTIDSSATLVAAAQLMRDANVGVLPIVEDGTAPQTARAARCETSFAVSSVRPSA